MKTLIANQIVTVVAIAINRMMTKIKHRKYNNKEKKVEKLKVKEARKELEVNKNMKVFPNSRGNIR